jgi:uridine kinase
MADSTGKGSAREDASNRLPPLLLLCGPSGVGKSAVADAIAATRPGLARISQDAYFGGAFVPYAEALRTGRSDMEAPGHVDWERLRIAALESRVGGCSCLLEGHAVVTDAALVEEASTIIFLDAPSEVCAARRILRRQRSEVENVDIQTYYQRFVWPAHVLHVRPIAEELAASGRATMIDATAPFQRVCAEALAAVDATSGNACKSLAPG